MPLPSLPAKFAQLPTEITTAAMMKHAEDGDLVIRLELSGPGDTGIHRIQGKGSRTYRFEYDRKLLRQCLRVPAKVWELDKGGMAYDIQDIPGSRAYRVIVRLEQADIPTPPPPAPPAVKKRRGRPPKKTLP